MTPTDKLWLTNKSLWISFNFSFSLSSQLLLEDVTRTLNLPECIFSRTLERFICKFYTRYLWSFIEIARESASHFHFILFLHSTLASLSHSLHTWEMTRLFVSASPPTRHSVTYTESRMHCFIFLSHAVHTKFLLHSSHQWKDEKRKIAQNTLWPVYAWTWQPE